MKGKKILFMGGKYVGYGCLKFLIKAKYNIVGSYINKEDTARDRWYNSIAELCLKSEIPVFYYQDVNSPPSVKKIHQLSPDIIVVVYYDQILKPNVISSPPQGCINLHLALAQVHRGCYPTTWSLIRGDEYTGVTLHYVTDKIDGGPAIAQRKIKIKDSWTGEDLYYQVSNLGIKLFKEVFPKLDKIKPYSLDLSKSKYYPRKFPSQEIKLDRKIYNKVRAMIFGSFPPPYIKIGKRKFIFKEIN